MRRTALALTLISTLLLVVALNFHSLALANPVPYPSEPNKEAPTLKVESPQNGEVYAVDTVELVFAVTKPDSWNFYWLGETSGLPVIGDYSVWVYLDGNLKNTYWDPCLRDVLTTNYSLVMDGLTRGGHSVKIDVEARTFYENPNPGPYDTDYFSYQLDNVSDTIHFTINAGPSASPLTIGASFEGPLGNFGITSTSNKTYSSKTLTLEVTGQVLVGSNVELLMTYSLDGQEHLPIPIEIRPAHPGDPFIGAFNGSVTLTQLSEGSHSITVFGDLEANGPHLAQATVYFTISDTTSPIISVLSVENKTYYTSDVPLNFTVNESVSQISYVLDGQENVTITGNMTLTGLSNGLHNITVYAKDAAGNTGASETVYFTIAQQEPFPTTLAVAASVASVAVVGAGLLVYFKRRNHAKITNTVK